MIQDAEASSLEELAAGRHNAGECLEAMLAAQVEAVTLFYGSFGQLHAARLEKDLRFLLEHRGEWWRSL